MTERAARNCRKLLLLAAGWMALAGPLVIAQVLVVPDAAPASDKNAAGAKELAFDVVSIKLHADSGTRMYGLSPTEFRALGMPARLTISMAYFGGPLFNTEHQIQGLPSWATSDLYDITAKLDDATIEAWKSLNPIERQARVAPLLQKMLAERWQMKAHTVPAEVQGFALVVGKKGAKMKESVPSETPPEHAQKLAAGGMLVPIMSTERPVLTYFQVSMDALAKQMTQMMAVPIVDQTGLTGNYDFELLREDMPSNQDPGMPPAYDRAHRWDWSAIGLELKPVKIPTVGVVIEHIERPSEN